MSHEEKMAEILRFGNEIRKHNEKMALFLATAKFLNKDLARISKAIENPNLTSEQVDKILQELHFIENKFQCEKRMLAEDDVKLEALKKKLNEI